MNFNEILRLMKHRGSLDEAKFNNYKNPAQPEWYRIFRFLFDVIDEFSWTQFLSFKAILKGVNMNLYYVVFEDGEIIEGIFRGVC